jgi:Holliday junction resolvase RusA-like endonuclease
MEAYELTLPYPPSNNHYKGIVKNPKRPRISKRTGRPLMQFFIPNQTKRFQLEVAYRFKTQRGIDMGEKRLSVEIDVYPPTGKRGYDLDNVPKVVLDSLQKAGAFKNDSKIDYLLIVRKPKYPNGMLKVRISELR